MHFFSLPGFEEMGNRRKRYINFTKKTNTL